MQKPSSQALTSVKSGVEFILQQFPSPQKIKVAAPLGLGKPNELLNALYQSFKEHPDRNLKIYTALSLSVPEGHQDLEKRFLKPFTDRHFGADYPHLLYNLEQKSGKIPDNIQVYEFYLQAGQSMGSNPAQRNYLSLNYTHVGQYLFKNDIQVLVQLVAKKVENGQARYSLSCNSDVTLDLVDLYKNNQKPLLKVAMVHPELPFVGSDAIIEDGFFDAIIDSPEIKSTIFALPRMPIKPADHLIGLHASRLLMDDGTIQVGIGSLSEALIHSTLLRHQDNKTYQNLIAHFEKNHSPAPADLELHDHVFHKGLYGTSEMVMDGFMHLRRNGILKREVFEHDQKIRRYLHGAFFLGSKELYQWLRDLSGEDFTGLNMTRVSMVNDLYDAHELALRRQRRKARFFNTTMMVTLLGGAASETLDNGQVVSGVGGQYNFVSMAHELPDSRSVLLLRSTHQSQGRHRSSIVWSEGHLTIPRHLRDVVITEYGIASLYGKTDEECIKALLLVTDAQFQEDLMNQGKREHKLAQSYQLPAQARNNTPEKVHEFFHNTDSHKLFPAFPFGSDFTPAEEKLALALPALAQAANSPWKTLGLLSKGLRVPAQKYLPELERLQLTQPRSPMDWIYQKLVLATLER